jgi:hypothetical protein
MICTRNPHETILEMSIIAACLNTRRAVDCSTNANSWQEIPPGIHLNGSTISNRHNIDKQLF